MQEFWIIFSSILLAFILGAVGILLIGSNLSLNYLIVKISRGKKILIFLKTRFGWVSKVGTKQETLIIWKNDKIEYKSNVANSKDIQRYGYIDSCYIDLDNPTTLLSVNEEIKEKAFDMETYNNILQRALTRPSLNETEKLQKMVLLLLVLVAVILLGVLIIYGKVATIETIVKTLKPVITAPVGQII
jgi:hypothetical protein